MHWRFPAAVLALTSFALAQQAGSRTAEIESAYAKLKEAEGKKDADGVLEWGEKTSQAARAVVAAPKPEKADEVELWVNAVDYAKQVDTYTEYSQFATAIGGVPGAKIIALTESIEKRNPKSEYLTKVYPSYIVALNQAGQSAKIMSVAESRIAVEPNNEDLLLVLADGFMNQKNAEKSSLYAVRLVEALKTRTKPEGLSDADWEKKKTAATARGYWISGVNHAEAKRYKDADEALRAALPLIQGQPNLQAPALFYLGVSNYNLGKPVKDKKRIADAIKFNDECAKLTSPFRDLAAKNSRSMRIEFGMK
jgi:tetratricopeptide (TPR) repeat protein